MVMAGKSLAFLILSRARSVLGSAPTTLAFKDRPPTGMSVLDHTVFSKST